MNVMLQKTTRTRFKAGAAVLATVGLALLAACGGETSPPPEATATSAASSETTAELAAARQYERNGQSEEAVAAYKEQTRAWPDSNVAGRASEALARLEAAHPELFPEEPAAAEPALEAVEAQPAEDSAAPAEEAGSETP